MTELPPLLPEYLEPVRALFEKPRVKQAMKLLDDGAEAAMVMQCELCEIPAPTFHEEVRAAEIVRRMKALGLKDVHVDEIGNVIGRRPGRGDGPVLAIGAHMDTVFPEGTPIKVRREGDRYWAPGIADNCCGLRCLLETIRAFEETGVETEGDIWFVGTVGEEGNGDIRGSKHLFNGTNHIDGFLAVDNADMGRLLYAAIGSHRYRFTITGPGGHSWTNFSECPSAVHAMCLAGAKVAHVKVPEGPRTTFTIGTIKGGTSVNTIAASCQVDVDMRSLDDGNLAALEAMIFKCFEEGVAEENAIWGVTDPAKQVRLDRRPSGRPASARLPRPPDEPRRHGLPRPRAQALHLLLDRRQQAREPRHPRHLPLGRRRDVPHPHRRRVLRRHPHRGRPQDGLPHGLRTHGRRGHEGASPEAPCRLSLNPIPSSLSKTTEGAARERPQAAPFHEVSGERASAAAKSLSERAETRFRHLPGFPTTS